MESHWKVGHSIVQLDLRKHVLWQPRWMVQMEMVGGWHTNAFIMDGCDGRGGVDGWTTGASTKDAWNKKYVGGRRRWTPTNYTSNGRILGLE